MRGERMQFPVLLLWLLRGEYFNTTHHGLTQTLWCSDINAARWYIWSSPLDVAVWNDPPCYTADSKGYIKLIATKCEDKRPPVGAHGEKSISKYSKTYKTIKGDAVYHKGCQGNCSLLSLSWKQAESLLWRLEVLHPSTPQHSATTFPFETSDVDTGHWA